MNWETGHMMVQLGTGENVIFQCISAECKVVHEFIGGYIFLRLATNKQAFDFGWMGTNFGKAKGVAWKKKLSLGNSQGTVFPGYLEYFSTVCQFLLSPYGSLGHLKPQIL